MVKHSNNSSAFADELGVFDHFVGLTLKGLTPPIMSDLFATRENNCNLRNFQELKSSLKRTVKFGTKTISYRGPQIWNLIPEGLRALETY